MRFVAVPPVDAFRLLLRVDPTARVVLVGEHGLPDMAADVDRALDELEGTAVRTSPEEMDAAPRVGRGLERGAARFAGGRFGDASWLQYSREQRSHSGETGTSEEQRSCRVHGLVDRETGSWPKRFMTNRRLHAPL